MSINGNTPPEGGQTAAIDPFDPASLRLAQSFAEKAGIRKLINTIPVRRPNRQNFVTVRHEPDYRLTPAGIFEVKEDREVYLVVPQMADQLVGEFAPATLFTAITRQDVLHIWPVKLPGSDGKHNPWHASAAQAAERAMSYWIRVAANMNLGAYEIFEASGNLSEPSWPDLSFEEVLRIAFRNRIVDSPDNPIVRRLKGAI